jgi:hypothetical protein
MSADIPAYGEDSCEVDLDDLCTSVMFLFLVGELLAYLIPVIIRELGARMTPLDSSTVHEDMNLMSIFQDCRRQCSHFFLGC